jgi:hypothetical protein
MKHFTVRELSLDKYNRIESSIQVFGGSRPRLTLYHRDGNQKYFFKTYSHTSREVWAECLASHLAELAGIKAQAVTIKTTPPALKKYLLEHYPERLPKDWKPIGTLSRNIFPKNIEIIYAAGILGTPSDPITLRDIEEKIRARYYAPEDLLQNFADMVVFDAFIGNMDRHHENWGVCEDKRYKQQVMFDRKKVVKLRYFTPLFDHGSSLMFELGEEKVQEFLNDKTKLEEYVNRSRFGYLLGHDRKKHNPFSIIEQQLKSNGPWKSRFKESTRKFVDIDLLAVASLVLQMPSLDVLDYNLVRRRLLYKSLLLRYNKIVEIHEKT